MSPDRFPSIPLSGWADRELRAFASASGAELGHLTGAMLLGERAVRNGFRVPGMASAGGGCRLYRARDGWIALSLARPDDRAMLPALFVDAGFDIDDDRAVGVGIASSCKHELVAHGADLGLAIAADDERLESPAVDVLTRGDHQARQSGDRPLVVDLSALWAGPLATHLLQRAGATVTKVESPRRPDALREGDPTLFARLNDGKASVVIDLTRDDGQRALAELIDTADIVIEASRPRALLQMGIDANEIVARRPGLAWISITGHGARGQSSNRVGFGDDCGVAGGLSAALLQAGGQIGFVGDAIADPLTGIVAAGAAWARWRTGEAARVAVSMSAVVAQARAEEIAHDAAGFHAGLRSWSDARGEPFPRVAGLGAC